MYTPGSCFLSGKAWDEKTAYVSPWSDDGRDASGYLLEHVGLHRGKMFLYIFDFGDDLRHLLQVEAVDKEGVEQGETYPRIFERHGENVPQYPSAEQEWCCTAVAHAVVRAG